MPIIVPMIMDMANPNTTFDSWTEKHFNDYIEFLRTEKNMRNTSIAKQIMTNESDPEMKEMAREEANLCEVRIPELEEAIKTRYFAISIIIGTMIGIVGLVYNVNIVYNSQI